MHLCPDKKRRGRLGTTQPGKLAPEPTTKDKILPAEHPSTPAGTVGRIMVELGTVGRIMKGPEKRKAKQGTECQGKDSQSVPSSLPSGH